VTKFRLASLVTAALLAAGCASSTSTPSTSTSAAIAGRESSAPAPSARAGNSATAFHPHFDSAPCPDDVTANVVLQVTCGYLTVLEDRAKPDGRTIQLFVVRVDPPGGTTTPDPVILIADFAVPDDYGGMVGVGQRTHRIAYLIDTRGIGHSKPSLDCPEVTAVGPQLAGLRLRDPARTAILLNAVRACHDRLVSQGIALDAYDLQANAEDIEDLRTTLGIATWNIGAEGDASRIALEVARRFPAGLRSMFIDSLTLPAPDFLSIGPTALDLAIARLAMACGAEPVCQRSFPHIDSMIRDATARLDTTPVTLAVTPTAIQAGHPIPVVVDGAALLRWIRGSLTADIGNGPADVPGTIEAVLAGKLTADDPMVLSLATDTGNCLGLLPQCGEQVNFGAVYSIACGSLASGIDAPLLRASVGNRPAYADVFDPSPLLAACAVWPVGHPEAMPVGPVTGGVPTLVLRGAFDPFGSPPDELRGAANVFLVQLPNASYNALGNSDCTVGIRNAWVDAPTTPPADLTCVGQMPAFQLAP
jgi:pimeloyl-ACP methyl ester carboxylesterase